MAIFGNQDEKDAKAAAKAQRVLAKYGLENIDPQYAPAVQEIARDLVGSGLIDIGGLLSNDDKTTNRAQTDYIKAIMKQNFIMIRQLDQIAYLLEQR